MVDFFIRRPVFATVCSLLIILAGGIAIPTLPIAQFPQLAPPQVSVSAFYTGANAQAVESGVTILLEQAINGAEGMRYISSSSGNDGSSSLTATFELGRDLDIAAVEVQNRASTALGRLPAEVQTTGLNISKNSGSFVLALGFYSEDGRYDPLFISNYLDVYVRDALKRVKGVGNVMIFGERKYAMRLWLDPVKLARRKLTASDVVSALREQNVQVAAGQIGDAPAMPNQAFQISVRAAGRLTTPEEFEGIVLKRGADGSLVQLRDVGRAELGAEGYGSNLSFNGHEAIGMGVMQLSNANALDVDAGVRAELARLAKQFPPGLKYQVAFNTTTAVGESIREVLKTLAEAVLIVILVIFLFLQTWRSTLIPAITIPVSLIGAFAFVKLFNFSINTLTLFGITLATGLVVDDAIVVIENVERHIEEGIHDAKVATQIAMKEVTGAVIATSLVLIAVFVPVSLFPGTTGRMYQQFALTIAFSIAVSAFNALTLTPALSALLLRHTDRQNIVFRGFNTAVVQITRGYRLLLDKLEHRKLPIIIIFIVGLAATYWIYGKVPTSFVPNEDQGYFIVVAQTPPGASLETTTKVTNAASAVLANDPDIQAVFSVPGFSFSGSAPNRGLIFVNLKDTEHRKGKDHSAAAIIERLRGPLFGIPDALVFAFQPPPIEGLGQFGGFTFELQQLNAGNMEDLQNALNKVIQEGSKRPELTNLYSDFSARDPQILVEIDREKAKSLGVSFTQITSTLQIFMGSQYVNDFDFNNRSYRVYVQADKQFRSQPRDLRQFYVRSDDGTRMVPLDSVVHVREVTGPPVIPHYNLFRSAEINGSAAPGYSSGQAIQAMEETARKVLPTGYSFEWTGLSLEEIESGSQSFLLFGLGLVVVYLTLAAQYESFVLPFIILLSVPMAILGALGAQWSRGLQNDVYCQIGLVMLIGLASKNGILIVEFAEQLQHRGMGLFAAAVEAARLRLRPILMTSVAFILGVLPLVFATGAGSAGRHSVGTTVVGGMVVSTFLNLFIIPVLYVIVRTVIPMKVAVPAEQQLPEPGTAD
ncbi:MAG TPA: multidrug efflux RND transporter permease subunit [Terriglobales bacterium]|nr:multidrug efflux RND transporter permease subunit [Terriglobales bacterium]